MGVVVKPQLLTSLRALRLPAFVQHHATHSALAAQEDWSFDRYLLALCELELSERERRRKQKLLAASKLPRAKTLTSFNRGRLKKPIDRQVTMLVEGEFLDRAENVLVFGKPGCGKSHLLAGLGLELIERVNRSTTR